jgi:potassium/chloride transporter 9
MTFLVTNLACFLLKLGSAPNFRPSFHFFNLQTAAIGAVACGATMFFVDGVYASGCVALLMAIFLLIHYTTPPKPWGDVSQGLIYHQVRKYLLRLRQEHVKFWRPQILLLVNDPRRQYKLIQFCNSLKKGGLFVLGHVIVSQDFAEAVPEARQQQQSWTKYIDFSKIKAFVNIAISPTVEWGARNLVLGAGLGGMRPNIVVMGFYNLPELRQAQPFNNIPSPQPSRPSSKATNHSVSRKAIQAAARQRQTGNTQPRMPTDAMKPEDAIKIKSYVQVVQDLVSRLQANVAIAKGFQELELPYHQPNKKQRALGAVGLAKLELENSTKTFIDLWPIQMSAEADEPGDENRKNLLTTNFDTYTLILQLGCILHTVPSWKRMYKLRVCVFVEYETDVQEERHRVTSLLKNLRIDAKILVFWLANGSLNMYEVIVNGKDHGDHDQTARDIDFSLEDERWWQDIKRLRQPTAMSASQELAHATNILEAITQWPTATFQHGRRGAKPKRFFALQKMLRKAKSRVSIGDLTVTDATNGLRYPRLSTEFDSDSNSVQSSTGEDDDADDEAVASESEAVVSGSNFDEYDFDVSSDESEGGKSQSSDMPSTRGKKSAPAARSSFFAQKLDLRKSLWKGSQGSPRDALPNQRSPTYGSLTPLKPEPGPPISGSTQPRSGGKQKKSRIVVSATSLLSSSPQGRAIAHPHITDQSSSRFSSNPTPRTAIASEDALGPSIMFEDSPLPMLTKTQTAIGKDTIDAAQSTATSTPPPLSYTSTANTPIPPNSPLPTSTPCTNSPASGFPAQQAIPLSFNDLPCRAQHLIINELIRQQSDDTAVVFTTLPSPMEGACDSESESVKYISDLEVLCQGLPPVLLVHSNSMTVTMNL